MFAYPTPNDSFKPLRSVQFNHAEWLLFAHCERMGQASTGVWPLQNTACWKCPVCLEQAGSKTHEACANMATDQASGGARHTRNMGVPPATPSGGGGVGNEKKLAMKCTKCQLHGSSRLAAQPRLCKKAFFFARANKLCPFFFPRPTCSSWTSGCSCRCVTCPSGQRHRHGGTSAIIIIVELTAPASGLGASSTMRRAAAHCDSVLVPGFGCLLIAIMRFTLVACLPLFVGPAALLSHLLCHACNAPGEVPNHPTLMRAVTKTDYQIAAIAADAFTRCQATHALWSFDDITHKCSKDFEFASARLGELLLPNGSHASRLDARHECIRSP